MWPYWLMFLVPAYAAIQELARSRQSVAVGLSRPMPSNWRWITLALLLLVGLRHEVGGDWGNYAAHFESAASDSRYAEWWMSDPGYRLLMWIGAKAGWSVHAVNLMGGMFFSYGLVLFCRSLPRPWLALAVSVPYVVLVLGMGYSRQGFALGCIMAGLVALQRQKTRAFMIWVVLGATFHKSALLLLPILALVNSQRRVMTLLWLVVIGFFSYGVLLENSVESLQTNYVDAALQSEGALVRLLMNAFPAVIYLFYRNKFDLSPTQKLLWFWLAVISLALFGAYFVSQSSTAVDRVGLYLLPIQMFAFAHLPEVLGRNAAQRKDYVAIVLFYYAMVEFVWLVFATHSFAWIPYRFYPFE